MVQLLQSTGHHSGVEKSTHLGRDELGAASQAIF